MSFFGAFKKKPVVTFSSNDIPRSPSLSIDDKKLRARQLFDLNLSYTIENGEILKVLFADLCSNPNLMVFAGELYNELALKHSTHCDHSRSFNDSMNTDIVTPSQQQLVSLMEQSLSHLELLSSSSLALNQEIKAFRTFLSRAL